MMNTYVTQGDTRPWFIALEVTAEVLLAVVANPEIGNIKGVHCLSSFEAVSTNLPKSYPSNESINLSSANWAHIVSG